MGARPAPGTTELLEVLDRALGGGIVIASGRMADMASVAPPAAGAQIVVTAFETYLSTRGLGALEAFHGAAHEAEPCNREEGGVTSATSVERSLILIVEDDEDSREVYTDVLVENGFEVETANSGVDGLRLARELHPGVILMDISLPDLDGWTVTTQLKADPKTLDIPVIIVTAYAFPEDRARADLVGCEGFLTKPCEPSRVLAEIQRLLAG